MKNKTNKSAETPQKEWKRKTLKYAREINNYIEKGDRDGWDKAGKEPDYSGREHLVANLLDALRKNQEKRSENFRDLWPPACIPLAAPIIKEQGQSIPVIALLDDGSIIARIGASYEKGYVAHITPNGINRVPGIDYFGQGPNKRYFAITKESGVSITDGWLGDETSFLPWPSGLEGIPEGYDVKRFETPPRADRLIPFPDGERVLLVGDDGIFVLTRDRAHRLLPTMEQQKDYYGDVKEDAPTDPLTIDLSMSHGAVSHNGEMIAVGSQDGSHYIFNAKYELIADVGNLSEYPHHAVFSKDDEFIALNSCHFYNGITIGVPTNLFGDYQTKPYELDPQHIELNDEDRVYAATATDTLFIVGNANGYIRGYDHNGKDTFRIFLGSSIGDIDISKDGKTLIASSYAGFLAMYDLESAAKAPHQIGVGNVLELRRWAFWKNEEPLAW